MIVSSFLWPVVIVSLPTVNLNTFDVFNKSNYTKPYCDCQNDSNKETMKHGYLTTEELIEYNIKKHQDILW